MSKVHVVGVSMTHFWKHLERSLKDLAGEALTSVLKDANCDKGMLDAVFFGNCVQGHMEGQDRSAERSHYGPLVSRGSR